jgi:hypothetical protein
VFLLLITGAELFACEALAPEQCESFGLPQSETGPGADDNCLCCCSHIVVGEPLELGVAREAVSTVEPEDPPKVERQAASIYHPPKA